VNEIQQVVLATGNTGKLREFQSLLGDAWTLIPQSEFGILPVNEIGRDFRENALLKARNAAKLAALPAIADDSGLEVDALGGAPGIYSARYAGDTADATANNMKLLTALENVSPADRGARFRCVIAFVRNSEDRSPVTAEGIWEGSVSMAPIGDGGFGYDPVFLDSESCRSAAQLGETEKNLVSHRAIAVRQLKSLLLDELRPRTSV